MIEALNCHDVIEAVALHYDISALKLKGHQKSQMYAMPRAVAMFLCRHLVPKEKAAFAQIAAFFGGRDHTTVMTACHKIEERYAADPQTRQVVDDIRRVLLGDDFERVEQRLAAGDPHHQLSLKATVELEKIGKRLRQMQALLDEVAGRVDQILRSQEQHGQEQQQEPDKAA